MSKPKYWNIDLCACWTGIITPIIHFSKAFNSCVTHLRKWYMWVHQFPTRMQRFSRIRSHSYAKFVKITLARAFDLESIENSNMGLWQKNILSKNRNRAAFFHIDSIAYTHSVCINFQWFIHLERMTVITAINIRYYKDCLEHIVENSFPKCAKSFARRRTNRINKMYSVLGVGASERHTTRPYMIF